MTTASAKQKKVAAAEKSLASLRAQLEKAEKKVTDLTCEVEKAANKLDWVSKMPVDEEDQQEEGDGTIRALEAPGMTLGEASEGRTA